MWQRGPDLPRRSRSRRLGIRLADALNDRQRFAKALAGRACPETQRGAATHPLRRLIAGLVDRRQPVVVLGDAATDHVEVQLLELGRDGPDLTRADRPVIDLDYW